LRILTRVLTCISFYDVCLAVILGKVWELSDVDKDTRLNPVEFAIAMHLIVCIR